MMQARLLERQQDSTWAMQPHPAEVAVNVSALRRKLLTKPWEELLELGRDALPPEVPDLRPQVPNPPETLVVRVRREGLDWPRYEFYGIEAIETPTPAPPEPEPEEPEDPQEPEPAEPPESPHPEEPAPAPLEEPPQPEEPQPAPAPQG